MKKKQKNLKLSLSKKTISSLDNISGGLAQAADTITKLFTPNACSIVSDPAVCGSTQYTGCGTC